jgi:hypothetical protein
MRVLEIRLFIETAKEPSRDDDQFAALRRG